MYPDFIPPNVVKELHITRVACNVSKAVAQANTVKLELQNMKFPKISL